MARERFLMKRPIRRRDLLSLIGLGMANRMSGAGERLERLDGVKVQPKPFVGKVQPWSNYSDAPHAARRHDAFLS